MAKFLKFKASRTSEGERDLLIGLDNLAAIENSISGLSLTYGGSDSSSDILTIAFDKTKQTSSNQMRNFFQDKMIQAQNANATSLILNIVSPIELTSYYVN